MSIISFLIYIVIIIRPFLWAIFLASSISEYVETLGNF